MNRRLLIAQALLWAALSVPSWAIVAKLGGATGVLAYGLASAVGLGLVLWLVRLGPAAR